MMELQRAQQIAEAASDGSRYRQSLPLRRVTVTADGYGVASYDFFISPGAFSLITRFGQAGGQAVTFTMDCIDGKQKELHVYFLECKHE